MQPDTLLPKLIVEVFSLRTYLPCIDPYRWLATWTVRLTGTARQGKFEECIADCDAAVEKGRELRTDFKLIGRALSRKGNALVKLDR